MEDEETKYKLEVWSEKSFELSKPEQGGRCEVYMGFWHCGIQEATFCL